MKKFFVCVCCFIMIGLICMACQGRKLAGNLTDNTPSGVAVSGNYPIVTDETGRERELRLGKINAEDTGSRFSGFDFPALYSQVAEGHYYYLRADGQGHYNIFCDQGDWVGMFVVEKKGYCVIGFTEYEGNFYAFLEDGTVSGDEEDDCCEGETALLLARVDFKKGKATVVYDFNEPHGYEDLGFRAMSWYRGYFYYLERLEEVFPEEDWKMMRIGDDFKHPEEVFTLGTDLQGINGRAIYLDGKVFYVEGKIEEGAIYLYSFDLKSGEKKEVLVYALKQDDIQYMDDFRLNGIDKDYIYIGNVMIPRRGGNPIVFGKRDKFDLVSVVYNSRYVFYIDKEYNIHRFCKDTQMDSIISDVKAQDIQCTENGIYVQENDEFYPSKYCDISDHVPPYYCNHYSFNLYYMDLDGKCKKRLTKGGNGKLLVSEK